MQLGFLLTKNLNLTEVLNMEDLDQHLESQKDLEEDSDDSDRSSRKGQNSTLPLVKRLFEESCNETGFLESCRMCLEQIREAMLHHRWQEAAEYMACYPQILENKMKGAAHRELVWRISTEILHHHPNSTMNDYNLIYERMKHSGIKLYLVICLEHSFHLMLHGQIEDAKKQLSVAESWRYGKVSAAQHQTSKLIQVYRSLLDYMIWCDKKSIDDNYSSHSDNQSTNNYFRQASVNLQEVLKNPGVWDPFILCYVEMLEFYGDHEEALKVLNDYAYDTSFPPNPNAHVYLYQYFKRHNAPKKKLIKVLKNIQVLVPSHELMLEYSSILRQSVKASGAQKALGILLDMLDFACWRSSLDVWKRLQAVIQDLQLQDDWENVVSKHMEARKDWWPALHFTSFHATKDSEESPELLEVKASLTRILCPDRALRYSTERLTP
ncbi:TATA box-binding protein-associated factor RNA polymerase I subunit A [Nematolebias whitei]|uniref:TATA box-binding protein-associated factor RNA polymerase I subunit A n=1 Tax=Nematolebias whitei TaxID=451745 RepID=UPI00189B57E5|nr:TATA box-binding protein-associated factor RNA polymerase I subunit A [Nematolebias whitei]